MIIVKLSGGMGNQLFQYAMGKALAEQYDSQLKVDISIYDNTISGHKVNSEPTDFNEFYHLPKFDISADEASSADIGEVVRFGRYGKYISENRMTKRLDEFLADICTHTYPVRSTFNYYIEHTSQYGRFNPEMLEVGPDAYINGYWETPEYFEDIRPIIEKEFELKSDLSVESQAVASRIRETESVGLHVRRGDFVDTNIDLPIEYFEKAIDCINRKGKDVFVVSTEMEWVKKNINIDTSVTYVDHHHSEDGTRTPKGHEYFKLLQLCDDIIISNSTFSWWAAWLGQNDDTTVVCPYIWRPENPQHGTIYVRELDLIPSSWNVIEWR